MENMTPTLPLGSQMNQGFYQKDFSHEDYTKKKKKDYTHLWKWLSKGLWDFPMVL